jgi:hypothetical protein
MKMLKKLTFAFSILFLSLVFFQFFQHFPSFFPLPDFTPRIWGWFEQCCAINSYEDRKDIEFLLTVLVSLLISLLCVVLFCRIARSHRDN